MFQKGHFVFLIKPTYCVKQNTDLKKSNTESLKNKVIEIQPYPLIQEKILNEKMLRKKPGMCLNWVGAYFFGLIDLNKSMEQNRKQTFDMN